MQRKKSLNLKRLASYAGSNIFILTSRGHLPLLNGANANQWGLWVISSSSILTSQLTLSYHQCITTYEWICLNVEKCKVRIWEYLLSVDWNCVLNISHRHHFLHCYQPSSYWSSSSLLLIPAQVTISFDNKMHGANLTTKPRFEIAN